MLLRNHLDFEQLIQFSNSELHSDLAMIRVIPRILVIQQLFKNIRIIVLISENSLQGKS